MLTYSEDINKDLSVAVSQTREPGFNFYIDAKTGKCMSLYTVYNGEYNEQGFDGINVILGSEVLFEHGIYADDTLMFDDTISSDVLDILNKYLSLHGITPLYYIVTHDNHAIDVSVVLNGQGHDRISLEHDVVKHIGHNIFINSVY